MKNFLAIFTCAEKSQNHKKWKRLDQQTQNNLMKKGMAAKETWDKKHKNNIIFDGGHLSEITKQVDSEGVRDIPSKMGKFVVIKASSHDEAAKLFFDHPHIAIFPGDGVEILEMSNIPRY